MSSTRSSPLTPPLLTKSSSNVSDGTPTSSPTVLKKSTRQQRVPNTERLSVLAQPRRRNSDPEKTTTVAESATKKASSTRKSISPNTKRPSSATMSRISTKAKSNFVKPRCSSQSSTADYFVEIFTSTVTTTPATKDSSSEIQQDKSYDVIGITKDKQSEYSSDSLITHSTDRSSDVSVNDVLDELRKSSEIGPVLNVDSSDTNKTPKENSSEKSGNTVDSIIKSAAEMVVVSPKKHTMDSISIPEPNMKSSPQKSPLFTSLLEKNHLKHHSSVSSLNNSFDIQHSTDCKTSLATFNTKKNLEAGNSEKSTQSFEILKTNSSISQEQFGDEDNSTDFGLSSDAPIDSLSLSTSSKNNEACATSLDSTSELRWANSRGVKFTGNKAVAPVAGSNALNETFVISGKTTQGNK